MTIVVGIRCNIAAVIRVKYYFAADILAPLQRTRSKEAGQIQIIVHVKTYVSCDISLHKKILFTFCAEDGVTYATGALVGPRYGI